jgi:hypothetical protein
MSEDIDKHVLRKYHIGQRLGKGVSVLPNYGLAHEVEIMLD